MQALLERSLSPATLALVAQLLRFGVVGVFGYAVDTAVVYALCGSLGLYGAGLVSFMVAASANWALHRAWTFRGLGSHRPRRRQWLRFLAANSLGFMVNRGVYAGLVTWIAACAAQPAWATAGGAIASMSINYTMSRRLVFR